MEVDTITTPTRWFEAVTGLCQWTFTSLGALRPLRLCSMDSYSFRRKSTGARISCIGGTSDQSFKVSYFFQCERESFFFQTKVRVIKCGCFSACFFVEM